MTENITLPFNNPQYIISIAPNATVKIGDSFTIRPFSSIEAMPNANLIIGNRVFFNNFCSIRCSKEITIGDFTMFGDGVKLFDFNHEYSNYHIEPLTFSSEPINIGKHCWIGANSVILKGVSIGDNVIIGANCLIYQDIPANSIVTHKEGLTIKNRQQAKYHAFTYTFSDHLENLEILLQALPEVDFHVAAPTDASAYLKDFSRFPNFVLYTHATNPAFIDDLLKRSDFYLDINHSSEVEQIISRAVSIQKRIFSFDTVVHQPNQTDYICPAQEPQTLVSIIKDFLSSIDQY